jgi:DNA replicative helicase MCM subunit Mcm2 (Cdc46/Mcm family)
MSSSFNIDIKGYDVVSIVNDINTSNNDPYLANNAILNEFNSRKKRKRNYNSMNMESNKISMKNNLKFNNIQENILDIDTIAFEDYFNQIIKEKETTKTNIYDENETESELDIEKYIEFVNEYVEPVISQDNFGDIFFLSEHIKSQFVDLQSYSLFDINWISVNTLQKFSKISARIDLRDTVNKEDIIKGYFMTKEFLQKNYVHVLLNKSGKAKGGHGQKAKIEFILEKLRQYINMSGDKITVEEIKSFGCFNSHEYEKIIDQLNLEGILLKSGPKQYQILLDY